ncbi:hypothetical protein B0H13DRAFT_2441779, partial [Mycena leptocephala]
ASSSGNATPSNETSTISSIPPVLTTSGYFNASTVLPPSVMRLRYILARCSMNRAGSWIQHFLYRQAFRLEPNVDRAYHTQEMLASINAAQTKPIGFEVAESMNKLATTLQRAIAIKSGEDTEALLRARSRASSRASSGLVFEPEDEQQPILLNVLPEELLILVIRKLDHTSIERFAAVSRKARELVVMSYKPPQIANLESLVSVVTQYHSDFRRVYIEHPRIRMDGVYIAVCHYVRFFPDGKVLSLLANEETTPAQLIPTLKPSLRKKGLFIGTWKLSESVVSISNLVDASGRYPIPPITTPGNEEPFARYSFNMVLSLRSRPSVDGTN